MRGTWCLFLWGDCNPSNACWLLEVVFVWQNAVLWSNCEIFKLVIEFSGTCLWWIFDFGWDDWFWNEWEVCKANHKRHFSFSFCWKLEVGVRFVTCLLELFSVGEVLLVDCTFVLFLVVWLRAELFITVHIWTRINSKENCLLCWSTPITNMSPQEVDCIRQPSHTWHSLKQWSQETFWVPTVAPFAEKWEVVLTKKWKAENKIIDWSTANCKSFELSEMSWEILVEDSKVWVLPVVARVKERKDALFVVCFVVSHNKKNKHSKLPSFFKTEQTNGYTNRDRNLHFSGAANKVCWWRFDHEQAHSKLSTCFECQIHQHQLTYVSSENETKIISSDWWECRERKELKTAQQMQEFVARQNHSMACEWWNNNRCAARCEVELDHKHIWCPTVSQGNQNNLQKKAIMDSLCVTREVFFDLTPCFVTSQYFFFWNFGRVLTKYLKFFYPLEKSAVGPTNFLTWETKITQFGSWGMFFQAILDKFAKIKESWVEQKNVRKFCDWGRFAKKSTDKFKSTLLLSFWIRWFHWNSFPQKFVLVGFCLSTSRDWFGTSPNHGFNSVRLVVKRFSIGRENLYWEEKNWIWWFWESFSLQDFFVTGKMLKFHHEMSVFFLTLFPWCERLSPQQFITFFFLCEWVCCVQTCLCSSRLQSSTVKVPTERKGMTKVWCGFFEGRIKFLSLQNNSKQVLSGGLFTARFSFSSFFFFFGKWWFIWKKEEIWRTNLDVFCVDRKKGVFLSFLFFLQLLFCIPRENNTTHIKLFLPFLGVKDHWAVVLFQSYLCVKNINTFHLLKFKMWFYFFQTTKITLK